MFEQIELRGNPHLRTLSYDPLTSFEPICYLVSTPTAIVVNGASPYTLADLFNAARAKPDELTLASVGPASATHIAFEMLKRTATVFTQTKPKLAAYTHLVLLASDRVPAPTVDNLIAETRQTYSGPFQVGEDLMKFEIGDDVKIRRYKDKASVKIP